MSGKQKYAIVKGMIYAPRIFIHGRHVVEEALMYMPRAVTKVYANLKTEKPELRKIIETSRIPVGTIDEGRAKASLKRDQSDQGLIASLSSHLLYTPLQDFMAHVPETASTAIVILSGVQDPHNVGAIIRTAAGFGAAGIIMPERGQAPITAAVVKASSGAAFRIPLCTSPDLVKTLESFKKNNFMLFALTGRSAGRGTEPLASFTFNGPTAFIMGNEGEGVPKQLLALCDTRIDIPLSARVESLNVAAATSATLSYWSTQHPEALL